MRWVKVAIPLLLLLVLSFGASGFAQPKLKVGYIYVGPIGDYGWTNAHDRGRKIADREAGTESIFIESVPEAQAGPFIDKLVQQGAKLIYTTSFGFMDATLAAAKKYPDVIFGHATGFKRAPNMFTYMADFYQIYYLNGMMAAALSKNGRLGYVAAFPIPEVKRHLDAFALGARVVNPRATVRVVWLNSWFDPAKAKEATAALIAQGAQGFAYTEDTPTVLQEAAKRNLPSFSHYSPMLKVAPKHTLSGQIVHWEFIYTDVAKKIQSGAYTTKNLQNVDYWWLLGDKAVEMGADFGMPINPVYADRLKAVKVRTKDFGSISVYDLVLRRLEQMTAKPVKFDPFTGPIRDRNGKLRVAAGHTMTVQELTTMEWAAPGVIGPWPNEPK